MSPGRRRFRHRRGTAHEAEVDPRAAFLADLAAAREVLASATRHMVSLIDSNIEFTDGGWTSADVGAELARARQSIHNVQAIVSTP